MPCFCSGQRQALVDRRTSRGRRTTRLCAFAGSFPVLLSCITLRPWLEGSQRVDQTDGVGVITYPTRHDALAPFAACSSRAGSCAVKQTSPEMGLQQRSAPYPVTPSLPLAIDTVEHSPRSSSSIPGRAVCAFRLFAYALPSRAFDPFDVLHRREPKACRVARHDPRRPPAAATPRTCRPRSQDVYSASRRAPSRRPAESCHRVSARRPVRQ